MIPVATALSQAKAFVEVETTDNNNNPTDGVCGYAATYQGSEPVVEVYVDQKRPVAQCKRPVKSKQLHVDGTDIRVDVIEVGKHGFHTMQALKVGTVTYTDIFKEHTIYAASPPQYRTLQDKIVGGHQISTNRTQDNWVGTLGGIFMATINGRTVYGALTNAHVTGLHPPQGMLMCQPDINVANTTAFGEVVWVSPFANNNRNVMDAALIDCDVDQGWWKNNRRWTVHPEQMDGFKLSLRWKDPQVGMRVIKKGRTTGTTRGVCTAVDATDYVNYGEDGTFGFVGMAHFKGDNGDLSGPGDSGSYIIEEATGDVVAHLFAGGGGITIGYPIRNVIEKINGRFAENPPEIRFLPQIDDPYPYKPFDFTPDFRF